MVTKKWPLVWIFSVVLGDLAVYLVVTLIGFASHETFQMESLPRMLATFFPFSAAWLGLAPWLGLYRLEVCQRRSSLVLAIIAAMFSAPAGALLRALWLGSPVLPVFALVMAAVSALCMFIWRGVLFVSLRRNREP